MNQEIVKLQVRTPLFMGKFTKFEGKKTKEFYNRKKKENYNVTFDVFTKSSELSVNSIKGVIRYWFRANYGFRDNLDEVESELLGWQSKASSIKFKIINNNLKEKIWGEDLVNYFKKLKFGKYKFSGGSGIYNGLLYFGHNFYNLSKKHKKIGQTKFFSPVESSFELVITSSTEDKINKILMVIWLALQFGGFGARSRRGFGNLKIITEKKIENKNDLFHFKNTCISEEDYQKTIKNNLKIVINEFNIFNNLNDIINKIPTLKGAQLFYSKSQLPDNKEENEHKTQMAEAFKKSTTMIKNYNGSQWIKAINFAGATMQLFRAMKEPDHNSVHNFNGLEKLERITFGLPLEFRFTNRKKTPVSINHYNEKDEATRFASPIIVSTTEIDNELYVQYLFLPFKFDELNVKATNGYDFKKIEIDKSIIENFKNHLENPPKQYNVFKYEELKNAF